MPHTSNISGFNRRFYMGRQKEGTYDSAATITHFMNALPGSGMEPTWSVFNRSDEFTGVEFEDRRVALNKDAVGKLNVNMSVEMFALLSAFALGDDAKSTPGGGTNTRLHTITPITTMVESPFTFEQHDNGASDDAAATSKKFTGCAIDKMRWVFPNSGLCRLEADIIASGTVATGSAQTESGLRGPDTYIVGSQCGVYMGSNTLDGATDYSGTIGTPATSLTNFESLTAGGTLYGGVREVTIEYGNNLDTGNAYSPGNSAQAKTHLYPSRRSGTVKITLDINGNIYVPTLAALLAGTRQQRALQITCVTDSLIETGFYNAISIVIPRMEVQWPFETSSDLGIQTRTFTFNIGKDTTGTDYAPMYCFAWNAYDSVYCT